MDEWLKLLHEAGIRPVAMLPETLALPWQAKVWALCDINSYCVVRTGAQSGFACDTDNIESVLSIALSEAGEEKPEHMIVISEKQETFNRELNHVELHHDFGSVLPAIAL